VSTTPAIPNNTLTNVLKVVPGSQQNITGIDNIKQEILTNGPVQAAFTV